MPSRRVSVHLLENWRHFVSSKTVLRFRVRVNFTVRIKVRVRDRVRVRVRALGLA